MSQTVTAIMIVAFLAVGWLLWLNRPVSPRPRTSNAHPKRPIKGDELAVWPFKPMPLMTNTEVAFFVQLQQALPEYLIFSQVQLSRIIAPIDDASVNAAFWFNRICRMSVDYVIVDTDGQRVLLAIELDDWTHHMPKRQQQDQKKDKALTSAGVPIIRFDCTALPSTPLLRQALYDAMPSV